MKIERILTFILVATVMVAAQNFSCLNNQIDVMKYFVMSKERRAHQFMNGKPNPIYTQVFPNQDFAATGYWFWLKSPKAHGFDVKVFNEDYVYMRSTELKWSDNKTFKRFSRDLPIAPRCLSEGKPAVQLRVDDTSFHYFSSCRRHKSSTVGTAVNDLDAPVQMDTGGNIGRVWTRVLHYHYNCDKSFQNCKEEEQFYLANGYGLWQWKHYKAGRLVKSALMNNLEHGSAGVSLPCKESYE